GGRLPATQQIGHAAGAAVDGELHLGVERLIQRDAGGAERLPVADPPVDVDRRGELIPRVAGEVGDAPVAQPDEVLGGGTRGGDVVDAYAPPARSLRAHEDDRHAEPVDDRVVLDGTGDAGEHQGVDPLVQPGAVEELAGRGQLAAQVEQQH